MNNEVKKILDDLLFTTTLPNVSVKLSEEKLYQLKDYITNLQEYKSRNEKAVDEIQQLIDNINNKTIIGLNNFLPKLEEIQDELADGVAEMSI
jgi:hypothetical protein